MSLSIAALSAAAPPPWPPGPAVGGGVLAIGNSLKGFPYVCGGTSPAGFDCSSFTQYDFGLNGVSLPRVASAQAAYAQPISRDAARPGDLVFFHSGSNVNHVGIYAGTTWSCTLPGPAAS